MRAEGHWLLALAVFVSAAAGAEIPVQRQQQLRQLLRHDCGSCHGMRLTGGLGPPLTPAALAAKPAPALAATISHGRPGTPMPPWAGLVSAEEARWLADLMKNGTDTGTQE